MGDQYTCGFTIWNNVDEASDTLTITSVVDVVHAGGGDVSSVNLLPGATLTLTGGVTCSVGQTLCTLPFGGKITFTASWYTVQPTDPNPLTDTATLTWQDKCDQGATNCPIGDQTSTTGSQSPLQTPTFTPTFTPTPTPTNTNTPTPTPTNTNTPTPTATDTATPVDTDTPTPTSTGTITPSPTPTLTPTRTNTPHHRNSTDTPVPPSATPLSQVSPAAVAPTATAQSTPTPFHQAEALPSSGGGSDGPTGGAAAAVIGCVLGGITLLESRKFIRNRH